MTKSIQSREDDFFKSSIALKKNAEMLIDALEKNPLGTYKNLTALVSSVGFHQSIMSNMVKSLYRNNDKLTLEKLRIALQNHNLPSSQAANKLKQFQNSNTEKKDYISWSERFIDLLNKNPKGTFTSVTNAVERMNIDKGKLGRVIPLLESRNDIELLSKIKDALAAHGLENIVLDEAVARLSLSVKTKQTEPVVDEGAEIKKIFHALIKLSKESRKQLFRMLEFHEAAL